MIPQFKSREEYYRIVKPRRIEYLRDLIAEHWPKVVICYGKAFWADFRDLFDGHQFVEISPFQKAVADETLVLLTAHFTARSMNGRFDEIVSIIADHQVT